MREVNELKMNTMNPLLTVKLQQQTPLIFLRNIIIIYNINKLYENEVAMSILIS